MNAPLAEGRSQGVPNDLGNLNDFQLELVVDFDFYPTYVFMIGGAFERCCFFISTGKIGDMIQFDEYVETNN